MNTPDTTQLDAVAMKQLTWKPGVVRNIAVGIVSKVILPPFKVWPDQISLAAVSQEDRHVVGIAWRLLVNAQVIRQTGAYRKSRSPGRNAGAVFEYELHSMNRAKTFLRRNGMVPQVAETQPDLLTLPPPYPNN